MLSFFPRITKSNWLNCNRWELLSTSRLNTSPRLKKPNGRQAAKKEGDKLVANNFKILAVTLVAWVLNNLFSFSIQKVSFTPHASCSREMFNSWKLFFQSSTSILFNLINPLFTNQESIFSLVKCKGCNFPGTQHVLSLKKKDDFLRILTDRERKKLSLRSE